MSHQSDLIESDINAYLVQHEQKDLLRFLTCGSVDDGKSTLIGRLLHDSKLIYEDQLAAIKVDSVKHGTTGDDVDLALLVDGLQAEREQGITIDVAYRFFSTSKRKFIIADTPGHEQYTRNMATGASTCNLAIILIDARHGVVTQTRRHTYITALLGIKHVLVAINKMDLADYSEEVFDRIKTDYTNFADQLELGDIRFVPISALKGDNVVHSSDRMPWYHGSTLMHILENVHIASDRNLTDMRFPVQLVNRPDLNFRGYGGTVASGVVRKGDEVLVLPSRKKSRVRSIVTYSGELEEAWSPMAVTLTLEDEIDVSRGNLMVPPDNVPHVAKRFEAMVVWMTEEPMTPGQPYWIKHAGRLLNADVSGIVHRVNINSLEPEEAPRLKLNEIGRCVVDVAEPIAFDPYRKNRQMGAFVILDRMTNNTVGAGMILDRESAGHQEKVRGLVEDSLRRYAQRHKSGISAAERTERAGHRPATLLLTGRVASGKSTIAYALERALFERKRAVHVLDGRNARLGLSVDLDFSGHHQAEGLRRAAEVSKLFNEAGLITICALVSARASDRALFRDLVGTDRSLLVHVSTPDQVCRERDPAGLYERADAGHLKHFPGVGLPYEDPESADLTLDAGTLSVNVCVKRIVTLLEERGILPVK